LALEQAFGRHQAEIKAISGVYGREVGMSHGTMADAGGRVRKLGAEFAENEGRRPRLLVPKVGQDGHDPGQNVSATAVADMGFAAKRPSPPPLPISALMSISAPCLQPPPRRRVRRSRTTCISSGCPRSPPPI